MTSIKKSQQHALRGLCNSFSKDLHHRMASAEACCTASCATVKRKHSKQKDHSTCDISLCPRCAVCWIPTSLPYRLFLATAVCLLALHCSWLKLCMREKKSCPAVLLVLDCMEREIFGMCSCQLTTWETFVH